MSIKTKFGRVRKTALATALSAVLASGLLVPAASQASAYGCAAGNSLYGPDTYCVYLSGGGTYVNYVSASWRGSAFACNAYITAEFFDASWNWHQTYRSGTQYGCGTGGDARINIYGYKWNGYMCSTLHYSNYYSAAPNRVMSVCHRVY